MSLRTRELGFLVPALLLGMLGLAAGASARADELQAGPWQTALGVAMVFAVMHAVLRMRAPLSDPYLVPIMAALTGIGLVSGTHANGWLRDRASRSGLRHAAVVAATSKSGAIAAWKGEDKCGLVMGPTGSNETAALWLAA